MTLFIWLIFLMTNALVTNSQYQDCTYKFKDTVAMFEYRYYPGYWTTPWAGPRRTSLLYAATPTIAKGNKNIRFSLHDCGGNTVCIESMASGWEGYYLGTGNGGRTGWNSIDPRHFTTFYDLKQHREEISGNRKGYKHKIYCTSCQPSADIYHDCRMFMVHTQQYWYTERDGKHLLARDLSIGSPNWFQWRIVSQPPREYWIDAEEFNNCHGAVGENAPAHISFETSITNSVSHTFTVEQKISIGLDAVPLLKKLGETTVTWSTENIRTWANSRKITVGSAGTKSKMVKPGWKWVIQQFVGDASFTRIGTNKYRFCDVECSSNAACPSA